MELCLRGTTIPDGHVLSFRTGETRRQAPVERLRKRPVRFPTDPERAAEPVFIEVMKVVASAQLVLQKGRADYSIRMDGSEAGGEGIGGAFDISLQLQGLHAAEGRGTGEAAAALGDERRLQNEASLAKAYLEEKGVMRYFQALLQAIVHDRPQDPYLFLLEQLQSRAELWVYCLDNGLSVAIRRTPLIGNEEHFDASASQVRPGERFRVIETRPGADGVLFLRLADGRGWLFDRKPGVGRMCERVREEVPDGAAPTQTGAPSKAGAERTRARALLVASWRSGELRGCLRELRGDPVVGAGRAEAPPPTEPPRGRSGPGAGDAGQPGAGVSEPEVHRRLRQGLHQACRGGEFQRAFDEVMGAARPAGAGAPAEAAPERQAKAEGDSKQKVRSALENALNGGQPQTAVDEDSNRNALEPQNARARIASGLSQATVGGDIDAAEAQDGRARIASRLSEINAAGAPWASHVRKGQGDAAKLRARVKLEERCSDGAVDALFRESMGDAERPPETSRGSLPAQPPAAEHLSPPRPGADPAVAGTTEPSSKGSPSNGNQTWMRGWSREWWSVQAEDMSVVQTQLQVLRGDNKALHEQLSLLTQNMEELRLENEALNNRLDVD